MYRNKKDIDKHVDTLMYKLTSKDFQTRACSVARLYYDVGDYRSCQKYVEQYLSLKSNNAAAHKLLGQSFLKLGQKTKALEQYIIAIDLDPSQTTTLLDICELLADEDVVYDTGRTRHFLEKTEAMYPKHPFTFRLRERILIDSKSDPERVVKLIKIELEERPRDAVLHARLLKHFLQYHRIGEAFDHSCDLEFEKNFFSDNYTWYECLSEVLKYNPLNPNDWLYQLFLLTVKERMCCLCLREVPNASGKNLLECSDQLSDYDQAIDNVAKSGYTKGFGEFHTSLLQHHKGQLALHAATLLLKKAKKDQLGWKEAQKYAIPLMLIAWQTVPIHLSANWLAHAPDKQRNAIRRHYVEGSYRCSQSGHYLISNIQDKSQILLDQISQLCSDVNWKDKLYEKLFTAPDQPSKKDVSYLFSNSMDAPALRFPKKAEVEAYDDDAQREYANSLHHFVWMLLNYKNFAQFKCTMFDMLKPKMTSCGPETLNKIDILSFLFCTVLTTRKQKENRANFQSSDNATLLPANITDLLCSLPQIKWWNCAYKLSQNDFGVDYTDIRSTLSQGIEVIRCVDNHGLDPELLCILGRIFAEISNKEQYVEAKTTHAQRACLYYSSAINLLEKVKNKVSIKLPERRMFDYTHKDIDPKELNSLIEESKLYVALNHLKEGEYEKVICLLSHLKSPQAYYHLSRTYKKIAGEENTSFSKHADSDNKCKILLDKAKTYAYKALEKIKELEMYKTNPLYTDIQEHIEDIEKRLCRINSDFSSTVTNDESSDETISEIGSLRNKANVYRNVSSTPKQISRHPNNGNATNYRTATDSQLLDSTHCENLVLERIENQIKNLQKRDLTINNFMEQTKDWFDENKKLANKIMSTIKSNIDNTTEQFKMLKMSIDKVKEQIDECRSECKDVVDLKKQIAELKKEVNKLKKTSEQPIDENDVYNLDDDYRANENTSTFATQLPFPTPQPFGQPFAQRIAPPFSMASNPYQLYGQNLYNLYNQYSQIAHSSTVQGAPPIFDPTRAHMNYPGVFPTPDQMYLDVGHLPPTIPAAANVPTVHNIPTVTTVAPATNAQSSTGIPTSKSKLEVKEIPKSLPVNVVITSSDPLPTTTSIPAPVLSVTIPQKHIKGSPHNYQIPMPTSNVTKIVAPPNFSFPMSNNTPTTTTAITTNWNMKSIFKPDNTVPTTTVVSTFNDTSKTVVDGVFSQSSPNTSLNKSRTLSEKSNTSIENYDPCPDFKPIIPLPAEVKVTTGEEDELVIFSARAKLFRFIDKQWKERGIGEMKLLKHKLTGKVRVLMRRDQVHKICANHIILPEMEIKPMKNETKAYIWVANDFAEETVILEKFCIKFKTPDIAKEYYEAFEKARTSSSTSTECTIKPSNINDQTVIKDRSDGKTVVGGFTFSSKPSFKTATEDSQHNMKTTEVPTNKVNVFTGLSFKTANASPFSNLISTTSSISTNKSTENTIGTSNKLNTSELVEEFEPTVDFKPVIPLPALVDQKTGEEDEIVLFEHRAKLLRFDAAGKEWKERGLGNIKLLCHKDNNQKLRLLMRREQIMKVCCNVSVNKEMIFQKMPNLDTAVTFGAKDFSEGEQIAETFCLRFKTIQLCDDFINAIKTAQSQISDDAKAVKDERNATKQTIQTGFGDKFKPQLGSWECKECFVRNEAGKDHCCACNSPKDPTAKKAEKSLLSSDNAPKFNFGIPSLGAQTVIKPPATIGWGDKFKAKEGTWECKQCYIRNESLNEQCSACNNPKNPDAVISKPEVKFSFGIVPKTNEKTIGQNASTFNFGITQEKSVSFGVPTTKSSNVFSVPKLTGESDRPTHFGITKNDEESITVTPVKTGLLPTPKLNTTPMKPALLPTPKLNTTPFGKEGGTFEFSFNKQNVTKGKSPMKSPKDKAGDESDDNEYASEDEGHHIHFSPVIPMPDKIKVVTGEENELELYGHRAKLFIFTNSEWKERGIGIVKVLKHKENGKLRVLMRREQVHKICLNHALNRDVIYEPKDEKSWFFFANDFSEGEILLQNFCLRFQNKEIALQFKEAIVKALKNIKETSELKNETRSKATDFEDVEFINEIQASNEDKQKARDLMLPENFFNYVNKEPCQGCRGCDEEDRNLFLKNVESKPITSDPVTSTPLRSLTTSIFQSPADSLYGTPSNLERTIDTAVFRTPLGAIGSNTKSIFTSSANTSAVEKDLVDKENTLTESPSFQSPNTPLSFGSGGKVSTLFGISSNTKTSILAPPKLSVSNTLVANTENLESSTVLSSSESKPIIVDKKPMPLESKSLFGNTGVSTNQSIFGFNPQSNKEDSQTSEGGSIFSTEKTPVNLFSSTSQGSIFGPAALQSNQSKPPAGFFSSVGTFTFGAQPSEKSFFAEKSVELPVQNTTCEKDNSSSSVNGAKKNIPEGTTTVGEEANMKPDALYFTSLSSSGPGFAVQKETNFKWEGAGQQLFTKGSPKEGDKTKNEESGDGAEEEYDPHYEPIVPLPDKIVVTTGEEDEEKLFGERCKLFRFHEDSRDWKERGIGEMKILYHPQKNSYRLLLRREQVHKAVLNMLLFPDLELLPMKNSETAWTWAGRNYADSAGEQETLAVRFKSIQLATTFNTKIKECVRKLQVAAAEAIRKEKEGQETKADSFTPLRLPKHLTETARADSALAASASQCSTQDQATELETSSQKQDELQYSGEEKSLEASDILKQVHFEPEGDNEDYDEEDYDQYYQEDSDGYYNEDKETVVYSPCLAVVRSGDSHTTCQDAQVQVSFDQDICSPKILVIDLKTEEILADMLIHTETEFQLNDETCSWTGMDYTSQVSVEKTVSITFGDSDIAMEFYDSCETSKASTYASTDP